MKMFKVLFSFLFLLKYFVKCEEVFKSVPVVVKTYENETVLLPCYVNDSELVRVKWYKDKELLGDSHDAFHLLPPRVRMHANYSLQIDMLRPTDSAHYTCEIIRHEPWGPVRQTHSVIVQYSPIVNTIPEDGYLEVSKGEFVDFGCEAIGVPNPVIDWKKNGEQMALLEHRSRIKFKAEHRLLAGVYECVASNGIGDPVTMPIRVVIQDAPVVSSDHTFVHTAVGLRAVLSAEVEFSSPSARTAWYKNGVPVKVDDRIVMMVRDNIHQLIFRSVRLTDFGNYTFRAENKLGMADLLFKLTGVPNVASFKVEPAVNKATANSYTLVWEVDSYSTIIEYNLWLRLYRPQSEENPLSSESTPYRWSKIVVPGDSTEGPIHSASYTVRGLTPSTVYEAIVTSRNRFGWSKQSPIHHFATEPGPIGQPISFDYADVTPVLEDLDTQETNITQAQVFERLNVLINSAIFVTPSLIAILIGFVGILVR